MLRNYLITAWRNFKRQRLFSLINLLGLALGMAACLLILRYVSYEWSFDRFVPQYEDVYRIQMDQYKHGEVEFRSAATFQGVGPDVQRTYPEINAMTRVFQAEGNLNRIASAGEQTTPSREHAYYVDSGFFQVFGLSLIQGNRQTALSAPNAVVLSTRLAQRLFGDTDPIGQRVAFRHWLAETWQVTGIYEDWPSHSHFQPDLLVSYMTTHQWEDDTESSWGWDAFPTYVRLQSGVDPTRLENQFPELVKERMPFLEQNNLETVLKLQPLADIHLHSQLIKEFAVNGNAFHIVVLLIIALGILIIAWINYVNLTLAQAGERIREIGVRKTLGAPRRQILLQLLLESVLFNLLGILVAITICQLALPFLSEISPGFSVGLGKKETVWIWLGLGGLLLLGTLVSGVYTASLLSSFSPTLLMKGKLTQQGKGTSFRKILVIGQFAASLMLLVGTMSIYQQLTFMRNIGSGVDMNPLLAVEGPKVDLDFERYMNSIEVFKAQLKEYAGIQGASLTRNIPGTEIRGNRFIRPMDSGPEEARFYHVMGVDYDFMDALGLNFVAGDVFDPRVSLDTSLVRLNAGAPDFGNSDYRIMVNEKAAQQLGFSGSEEALGKQIQVFGGVKEIVGVVENYHHKSLHHPYEPIIFYPQTNYGQYFLIRFEPQTLTASLAFIEKTWAELYPGQPFRYHFMDEFYGAQYEADQRLAKVVSIFAFLAVLIACMGLYGLSAYHTQKRTKEIGIRKVLGAGVLQIVNLLSQDFLKLVGAAGVIAIPLAYIGVNKWLQGFAFRTELQWEWFGLPLLGLLVIAVGVVSIRTLKSALANPVEALRYE